MISYQFSMMLNVFSEDNFLAYLHGATNYSSYSTLSSGPHILNNSMFCSRICRKIDTHIAKKKGNFILKFKSMNNVQRNLYFVEAKRYLPIHRSLNAEGKRNLKKNKRLVPETRKIESKNPCSLDRSSLKEWSVPVIPAKSIKVIPCNRTDPPAMTSFVEMVSILYCHTIHKIVYIFQNCIISLDFPLNLNIN